jgi:hypothetical protein
MKWLARLFGKSEDTEDTDDDVPQKLHCIRFMTDRGEQVAILLTSEEFERGMLRWVETIDTMPIESIDENSDEGVP